MYYQELFNHMSREHGLTLLRSEMHEIELIVAREQNSAMGLGQPVGREADREFEVAWETAGFPWEKQPARDWFVSGYLAALLAQSK